MKKRTPVSKIMTTEVLTVNKTNSIREVDELFKNEKIRHVPVVSGTEIIGMMSSTDLQKISFVNNASGEGVSTAMYDALSIEQVMTKNVKSVDANDMIQDVAKYLASHEFHALPVTENSKLVGIVTTTDLLNYLIEQYN